MSVAAIRARTAADGSGARCPAHVAIIMDGNGRWAASRHLPQDRRPSRRRPRGAPHHRGGDRSGVGWLTLYAFSSENWRRPAGEVLDLTGLLRQYLKKRDSPNCRRTASGCASSATARGSIPTSSATWRSAETTTAGNTRLNLTVALSYGARAEIAAAARAAAEAVRDGRLDAAQTRRGRASPARWPPPACPTPI